MSKGGPELLGRFLFALADMAPVDHDIMLVSRPINADRTKGKCFKMHVDRLIPVQDLRTRWRRFKTKQDAFSSARLLPLTERLLNPPPPFIRLTVRKLPAALSKLALQLVPRASDLKIVHENLDISEPAIVRSRFESNQDEPGEAHWLFAIGKMGNRR
jgi:hypothetical protein